MIRAISGLLGLLVPAMAMACVITGQDTEAELCRSTLKAPSAVTGRFAGPVQAIRTGTFTSELSLMFVAERWLVGSGAARTVVIYRIHPEDGEQRTRDQLEAMIRSGATRTVFFHSRRGQDYVIAGSPVFCGTPLVFNARNAGTLIAARNRPSLCRNFKRR